jgi:hypothetical protein
MHLKTQMGLGSCQELSVQLRIYVNGANLFCPDAILSRNFIRIGIPGSSLPHPNSLPVTTFLCYSSHACRSWAGGTGQAHLVSLVLQSKKALQHGEQLCTRAHNASNTSAQAAIDVLALDAKIKWMVEAVVEQLKVGSRVRCLLRVLTPRGFSLRQVLLRVLKRNARTCSNSLMFVYCLPRIERSSTDLISVFRSGTHPGQNMQTHWMPSLSHWAPNLSHQNSTRHRLIHLSLEANTARITKRTQIKLMQACFLRRSSTPGMGLLDCLLLYLPPYEGKTYFLRSPTEPLRLDTESKGKGKASRSLGRVAEMKTGVIGRLFVILWTTNLLKMRSM